jgi:hypothetical protein
MRREPRKMAGLFLLLLVVGVGRLSAHCGSGA